VDLQAQWDKSISLWTEEKTISSNAKIVLVWAQRASDEARFLCCIAFNVLYGGALSIKTMMGHAQTEFQGRFSSATQCCVQIPVFDLHENKWQSKTFWFTNGTLQEYTAVEPRTGTLAKNEVANELKDSLLYNIQMLRPATAPATAPAAAPAVATVTITGYVCLIWQKTANRC